MNRFVSRTAMLLVIAAGAISCSESPTSFRRAPVHLSLAPHFAPKAAAIYRSLSGFSVTIDQVRIIVQSLTEDQNGGAVLKDTLVAFPANASELTIDLDLTIPTQEQLVIATMILLQGSTPYFGGAQTFDAKQGETATASQPLELVYVGPGAAAASLQLAPLSPTLAPSSSFQFSAQALDITEHAVTDLPLAWATSDATIATVSQTGLVTSTAKGGSVTLTVTGLNGLTEQTTVRVLPVASLVVHTGADQSASAGSTLTSRFEVRALDANQQPVIGAPITFTALNGAGTVSPSSATTDANGYASTSVTLGSAVGTYTFTAQASGTTTQTRIVATANAGAAASLSIATGNQQADSVMATFGQPLTVRVTDSFGNPVPSQVVDFKVTSGTAGLLASAAAGPAPEVQVPTGTDGSASVSLVGGAVAGTVHVAATISGAPVPAATFEETLKPGVASRFIVVQQPPATAQATITLGRQPKVQVTDLYGNPVALAGLPVMASAQFDCGTGVACVRLQPPNLGGALLDRSTAPGISRAQTPRRPTLTRAIPRTSRIAIPVKIAATRSVSDTFPRGLGGTTVVLTDGNGIASFTDLSLNLSVGNWLLAFTDTSASYGAALSNSIVVTPGPITSIVAEGGADTLYFATTSDTLHPAAMVIDAVGNGIPGVTVTWTVVNNVGKLDSLTTTTDINGVASPGNWLLSVAGVSGPFEILATPNASNVENAPLPIFAVQIPQ